MCLNVRCEMFMGINEVVKKEINESSSRRVFRLAIGIYTLEKVETECFGITLEITHFNYNSYLWQELF